MPDQNHTPRPSPSKSHDSSQEVIDPINHVISKLTTHSMGGCMYVCMHVCACICMCV